MSEGAAAPEEQPAAPRLSGPRLVLRPLAPTDAPAAHALLADPEVMAHWSTPPHADLAQTEALVERLLGFVASGRALEWVVATHEDPTLVGRVTLFGIDREQGRAELGGQLGRALWGRGLAAEAQRLVLAHAFDDEDGLGLRRVEAFTDPENAGATKALERLGFVREGTLRERWIVGGVVSDDAAYGLLARDFRAEG